MLRRFRSVTRWLPAVGVMALIFFSSSIPGSDVPDLGPLDLIVKKAGHIFIYAALAVAFWYALGWRQDTRFAAWLLAVLYAATDEAHQSFTPGRHAWWLDVIVFDALGALLGLWLARQVLNRQGLEKS